jgi:hypothetical protein
MFDPLLNQICSGHIPEAVCDAPEGRLMLAVLQDALATFQRGLNTPACEDLEAFREVDRWFRSRDYDSPFSFESICSTLGMASGCVRDGLNKVRQAAFASGAITRRRMISRERSYPARTWNDQRA